MWAGISRSIFPDPGDATDLEVSSRFQVDEPRISGCTPTSCSIARAIRAACRCLHPHEGILFSVRNEELPVFRLQRRRARDPAGYVADCRDLLLDLYGADVEYSADSLEDIYTTLGRRRPAGPQREHE